MLSSRQGDYLNAAIAEPSDIKATDRHSKFSLLSVDISCQ